MSLWNWVWRDEELIHNRKGVCRKLRCRLNVRMGWFCPRRLDGDVEKYQTEANSRRLGTDVRTDNHDPDGSLAATNVVVAAARSVQNLNMIWKLSFCLSLSKTFRIRIFFCLFWTISTIFFHWNDMSSTVRTIIRDW